jgi:hypothetical protein
VRRVVNKEARFASSEEERSFSEAFRGFLEKRGIAVVPSRGPRRRHRESTDDWVTLGAKFSPAEVKQIQRFSGSEAVEDWMRRVLLSFCSTAR